jgi:hypothetical protein
MSKATELGSKCIYTGNTYLSVGTSYRVMSAFPHPTVGMVLKVNDE